LLRRKNQSDGAVGSNPPRGWQSKQGPLETHSLNHGADLVFFDN
jgi:hypothetical protein